jgi:hypothetical protein
MKWHIPTVCALTLILCAPAQAQVGLNGIEGGVGTVTAGPFNTNILAGGNAELGIQYYPPNGRFYISRRGTGAGTVAPHTIIEADQTGAFMAVYPQGPGAGGGVWGHRDGATDAYATGGPGLNLFFGDDFGVHCYDMSTGSPVYTTGTVFVMANNGPQPATFPMPVQALTGGITRALEYNPAGNGGNGSFWTCNFGGPLVEFDLSGGVLSTFAVTTNPAPQWSAYGLAMNMQTGMLWCNSSPAGVAGATIGAIVEIDPATGLFTGRSFLPSGSLTAAPWIYAAQGGLCYVEGRTGPTYGPAASPPFSELCALTQGTPDYFELFRLDLESGFPSELETRLEASINGGAFTSADQSFAVGNTLSLQYNTPAANPGSPAITLANIGVGAPAGNTGSIAELTILSSISTPTALGSGVLPLTIGDGFLLGGILAPDFLLLAGVTQPTIPSPALPLPSLGGTGTQLTIQGAYISPTNSLVATNKLTITEL